MNPEHDVSVNLYELGWTILDLHQGEDFFKKGREKLLNRFILSEGGTLIY